MMLQHHEVYGMSTELKVRENRVRRALEKLGYRLQKMQYRKAKDADGYWRTELMVEDDGHGCRPPEYCVFDEKTHWISAAVVVQGVGDVRKHISDLVENDDWEGYEKAGRVSFSLDEIEAWLDRRPEGWRDAAAA